MRLSIVNQVQMIETFLKADRIAAPVLEWSVLLLKVDFQIDLMFHCLMFPDRIEIPSSKFMRKMAFARDGNIRGVLVIVRLSRLFLLWEF